MCRFSLILRSAGRSDNGTGMERVSQIGLDWRTMRIGGGPGCRGENSSQLAQGKLECPGGHDYHADQNGAICRTMKIMPRTHMESTQNRRNIEHGIRLETGNQAGMSKGTHQSEKGPGSVALSRLREPSGCRVFLGCLVPVSTALGGGEETHTWYPDRHEARGYGRQRRWITEMDKRAPTSRVGESGEGEGEVTRGPGDGMPVLLRADGGGRHVSILGQDDAQPYAKKSLRQTPPASWGSWSKDPSTTDSAEIPPESRNLRLVFSNKRNSHQSPEVNVTVKGLLLKCPARLIAELNYSFSGKKINPSLSGIEKKTTCFRPHLDVGEWVCPPAGCQMGWWACPWWAYPLHGKGCGIVGMPTDGGHAHGGYAHLADKIVGMPTIGWWACPRMVGMPTDGGHARGEYAHLADRMVGMPTLSGLFSCSSFRQRFYMMVHQAALGLCREDMVILR
ncbi:hypothetical protein FB45DRAFT_871413 [Roridomyces roridus]|uniref:Uncharacterized protein n=1 Tax=Roridomyces roridus TaxID=1738132 RepID=A0AAD7BGR0_9AGAR|nr:hypothetical protein FB45DRAFT_871413 [Roridomyces roridus]